MSTNATYSINNVPKFCTHYDGYLEGAAARFYNAIVAMVKPDTNALDMIADVRGGFEFAMIRGNNDVEPSNAVGCEFDYNIITCPNGEIFVEVVNDTYKNGKVYLGKFEINDFINKYAPLEDHETPIVKVTYGADRIRYTSKANAEYIGDLIYIKAGEFGEDNPNRKNYFKKAEEYRTAK